jgi:hypothetical protein
VIADVQRNTENLRAGVDFLDKTIRGGGLSTGAFALVAEFGK